VSLTKTIAMIELIEDLHPDHPLHPADPFERAAHREMIETGRQIQYHLSSSPVVGTARANQTIPTFWCIGCVSRSCAPKAAFRPDFRLHRSDCRLSMPSLRPLSGDGAPR
jgi:hypothetical protein